MNKHGQGLGQPTSAGSAFADQESVYFVNTLLSSDGHPLFFVVTTGLEKKAVSKLETSEDFEWERVLLRAYVAKNCQSGNAFYSLTLCGLTNFKVTILYSPSCLTVETGQCQQKHQRCFHLYIKECKKETKQCDLVTRSTWKSTQRRQ